MVLLMLMRQRLDLSQIKIAILREHKHEHQKFCSVREIYTAPVNSTTSMMRQGLPLTRFALSK